MPKPKKYNVANEYDTSVECAFCGMAIHENLLVFVSKDAIRCPNCNAVFKPKRGEVR